MPNSQPPGVVGPFAGLDVPWLPGMRAKTRRDHPFLIWAPFDAPARHWSYGEFHDRVGALAAGLVGRGIKPGDYVLIHLDNCIEAVLAWFACVIERAPPDLHDNVMAACRNALADFKVPREIRFVDEMPRSTLEKVAKAELRKMLG
jgi:acyl-CoA synthetase (AMP-forming)/AMP-acid ligase II